MLGEEDWAFFLVLFLYREQTSKGFLSELLNFSSKHNDSRQTKQLTSDPSCFNHLQSDSYTVVPDIWF